MQKTPQNSKENQMELENKINSDRTHDTPATSSRNFVPSNDNEVHPNNIEIVINDPQKSMSKTVVSCAGLPSQGQCLVW